MLHSPFAFLCSTHTTYGTFDFFFGVSMTFASSCSSGNGGAMNKSFMVALRFLLASRASQICSSWNKVSSGMPQTSSAEEVWCASSWLFRSTTASGGLFSPKNLLVLRKGRGFRNSFQVLYGFQYRKILLRFQKGLGWGGAGRNELILCSIPGVFIT